MGLLDKIRKKANISIHSEVNIIYAPVSGKYIPLEQIPDETFSQGILGAGCGIEPIEGRVYAPVDGVISVIAETKHAIGLTGKNGEEYLIHIGLDTVDMKGNGFFVKVQSGDTVKAGQLLMEFSIDDIQRAKHSLISGFVIVNAVEYPDFHLETGKTYKAGEAVGKIK